MNTALFDLIEAHDIDPAKVKQLRRCAAGQTVFDLHGKLARSTRAKFDALISTAHYARSSLHDHEADARSVHARPLRRSAIRAAAAAGSTCNPIECLTGVQATVEFELADGTRCAKRGASTRAAPLENPLTTGRRSKAKLRT